jgi:hypothetical protein
VFETVLKTAEPAWQVQAFVKCVTLASSSIVTQVFARPARPGVLDVLRLTVRKQAVNNALSVITSGQETTLLMVIASIACQGVIFVMGQRLAELAIRGGGLTLMEMKIVSDVTMDVNSAMMLLNVLYLNVGIMSWLMERLISVIKVVLLVILTRYATLASTVISFTNAAVQTVSADTASLTVPNAQVQ